MLCTLVEAAKRYLMRPDFVRNLRRKVPHTNPKTRLDDFCDGTRHETLKVGMKRIVLADGSIRDVELFPGSSKTLSECDVGLSFNLNVDW